MYGLRTDWEPEQQPRVFFLEDYDAAVARWCPGCGDHGVLGAVKKLARDKQLPPEQTVIVSGIGCSSRFPHYMKTYGFHGLHGRPLPIASGIRSRRPDLHMFVVTGDGDCCAIGTAHWIHAIRYNMKMTVLMFDNNIYGLTKMQTSPTTRKGETSNTHPQGNRLEPLNPLSVTLGITNASFVAQTIDWNPPHLYATIRAAHEHDGLAFVRVLQRCPHFTDHIFKPVQNDPSLVRVLEHPDGIPADETVHKLFQNFVEHDPRDLAAARALADDIDVYTIGLFYRSSTADRYDQVTTQGLDMTAAERRAALEAEIERFAI